MTRPLAPVHSFRDVETAAYCPRKLYYRRRQSAESTPPVIKARRNLAFRYEQLLADDEALESAPIEVTPTQFRTALGSAKARLDDDVWSAIVAPAQKNVFLRGRDCHGNAHKLLETPECSASLVFGGAPPETGVWKPQSVRLVAVAKALSWERETSVERVVAEYPACGVIREVTVNTRRTAAYRQAVRTAAALDGPPARTHNRSKCTACEFQSECGVRTRSLRSILGE